MENKELIQNINGYITKLKIDNESIETKINSQIGDCQLLFSILNALEPFKLIDEEYQTKLINHEKDIEEQKNKHKHNKEKISAIEYYLNQIDNPERLKTEIDKINKKYQPQWLP